MPIYLARSCPVCRGYLGVTIERDEPENAVRAIDAQCLRCGFEIDWKLIRGSRRQG